jgi:hypothetical protein
MSIFDVFSFKKKFAEVFNAENFAALRDLAKEKIIEQVKEEITGEEKMDKVVETIINFIKEKLHSDNKLVQWVIDNILIPNIRTILQAIYDDLKQKIKGL